MGLFGLFYTMFVTGTCLKETAINSSYKDEQLKLAINENRDIFYDKSGYMYFIKKLPTKSGNTTYIPIRAIDSVKYDKRNLLHKVVIDLKTNEVLRDYTQEKINDFYKLVNDAINDGNDNESQNYYFIPIDYNLVRNIGDVNFKKHFKPMCGLFEKDNGKVGRRYLVERYYNKTTKKYEYYKYFYDDHNWIDIFSKIKISKEDYEKMGGENREYISSLYFDMV